jgi:predicted Abi (CAAX) family protease
MRKEYRPGSMGAAEQKSAKTFSIVAGVIYLLIILCLVAFPVHTRDFFARASTVANVVGIALIVVSYIMILLSSEVIMPSQSGHWYWISVVVLLALGFALACGFNFDLAGLPQR